jgi:hypothetical protein
MFELSQHSFSILPDGSFSKADGIVFKRVDELLSSMVKWVWKGALNSLSVFSRDPRSSKYKEEDGNFLVPPHGQSDFLYVPFKYADQFIS